mmetsp:Transcript_37640/g.83806  ORF Transcript_37640/g.83806 Transcript_37640/m.83806 type:complete len:88 (-) Transcript_37640:686-949(-)
MATATGPHGGPATCSVQVALNGARSASAALQCLLQRNALPLLGTLGYAVQEYVHVHSGGLQQCYLQYKACLHAISPAVISCCQEHGQ